jgi:hypothetical protein
MTPSDSGRRSEGTDSEDAREMGSLFDEPGDDERTTFDMDVDHAFALDGAGQFLVEGQVGGFGIVETSPGDDPAGLDEPPAGQQWRLIGPNKSGEGYDWETVPIAVPVVSASALDRAGVWLKKNATVSLVGTALLVLGYLFYRKRKA